MHTIYNISGTTYLEPNKEYSDETIYPNFQKDYRLFKETLKENQTKKLTTLTINLAMEIIYYLRMKNLVQQNQGLGILKNLSSH